MILLKEELVRWLTNFKDYKEIELLSDKDYFEKTSKRFIS